MNENEDIQTHNVLEAVEMWRKKYLFAEKEREKWEYLGVWNESQAQSPYARRTTYA